MIYKLLRWIRGTVTLFVEGGYAEILLGDMTKNDIPFWSVFRVDAASLAFTLPADQKKRVLALAAKRKLIIKEKDPRGLPQFLRRYKARRGLFVGMALAGVLLALMHLFLWDIQVVGCEEKLSEIEVREWLSQNGVKQGGFRFGLDTSKIENDFVLEHESAVWMSINLKATTAVVELQERTDAPKPIHYNTPTSIYAARDGKILSFTMMAGEKTVQVGEAVQAGDLLVTGEIPNKYGGYIYIHADAIVLAKTEREISLQVPLLKEVRAHSGKTAKKYTLELFGCKIPLYFNNKISYNIYDTTTKVHRLRVGSYFALPFALYKTTFHEVIPTQNRLSEQEAKAEAMGKLVSEEKGQLADAQIEDAVLTSHIKDDILYMSKKYICIENIALQREITEFYKAESEEGREDVGKDHSNGIE